jgi:hypothetical protein
MMSVRSILAPLLFACTCHGASPHGSGWDAARVQMESIVSLAKTAQLSASTSDPVLEFTGEF